MVAHCWRFHADVRALRDRIAAGALGEVVKTRGYGVHAAWGPQGWFVDPELAGGGALVDMGVHAIDTARFLLGDPQPARGLRHDRDPVRDVRGGRRCDPARSRGIRARTASSESGWWQPHAEGLEAETEVYATRGYARIFPREAPGPDYEHCTQPMYTEQMREFFAAVAEGRPPRPSGDDGRVVLRIVEDARRANGG